MPVRLQLKISLELLLQLQIDETSEVIIIIPRIFDGVLTFEPEFRWRVLTEDVVYAQGYPGVVEHGLPARHGVSSDGRRFFATNNLLTVLGVPGHRGRFHRSGESNVVGSLCVKEPGLMDPVLLPKSVKMLGKDLFQEAVGI